MAVAVYPGSFDPVTFGHLDIIGRASAIFDRVYVAVLRNPAKTPLFSVDERLAMLKEACQDLANVRCEAFSGLVVDFARSKGARVIVRGLRALSDFEYEFVMAAMNRHLNTEVETVFIMTSSEYAFVSSSLIKEVAQFGGDVTRWVPPGVARRLAGRFGPAGTGCGKPSPGQGGGM